LEEEDNMLEGYHHPLTTTTRVRVRVRVGSRRRRRRCKEEGAELVVGGGFEEELHGDGFCLGLGLGLGLAVEGGGGRS